MGEITAEEAGADPNTAAGTETDAGAELAEFFVLSYRELPEQALVAAAIGATAHVGLPRKIFPLWSDSSKETKTLEKSCRKGRGVSKGTDHFF